MGVRFPPRAQNNFAKQNFLRKRLMWYLYIAKCNDGTLYAGITKNVQRRELEHNTDNKRGAKSLQSKRPIQIVYTEQHGSQTEARKREIEIKGWKRKYKLKLIRKA